MNMSDKACHLFVARSNDGDKKQESNKPVPCMPCTYAAIFCTLSTFQVSKESCLCKGVFFQYQFEIIVGTIFFSFCMSLDFLV